MFSSKVVWVALVCAIVVCGYPISEPRDALDQDFIYGQYIRNLEKKHRFSYNEIDEPLQPVLDDDEVELSLLAQPVSQPPSEDGITGSTSAPIVFTKDSAEEDDKSSESPTEDVANSSENEKVEKDSSDESSEKDEAESDVKAALEPENEKQEESSQDSEHMKSEVESAPMADPVDEVVPVADPVEEVPVADPVEEVVPTVADPVEEVVPSEIAPLDLAAELPQAQDEIVDVASAFDQQEPVEGSNASDVTDDSLSSVTDAPVAADASEELKEEPQAVESIQDQAVDSPATDLPVFDQNVQEAQDEAATSASVSENDEGSGFLAADPVQVVEENKENTADEAEGSGFLAADAQSEKEVVVGDELTEEGSGFFKTKTEVNNDEGSGFLADPLPVDIIQDGSGESVSDEGSGSFDETKVETTEELKVSDAMLTEADGSGDAEISADEESTVLPAAENDEPQSSIAALEDHVEQHDDSPVKEEYKLEDTAEELVKYIPVEVIVETEGQLNTEEKVNEPETTESSSRVETDGHQSSDVAALPEADNTEAVQPDQPSVMELVPETGLLADNAESASEQPQEILQSDDLILATDEPQQSSTLL